MPRYQIHVKGLDPTTVDADKIDSANGVVIFTRSLPVEKIVAILPLHKLTAVLEVEHKPT